jgi:hypothetical protein
LAVGAFPLRAILADLAGESPAPASILPVRVNDWTARQACNPPRATTCLPTICATVRLLSAGLLSGAWLGAAPRPSEEHRPSRTPGIKSFLPSMQCAP